MKSTVHLSPAINLKLGITLALLSNVLFAVLYLYSGLLKPLSGTGVFVWRILMMCAIITFWLVLSGQFATIKADLQQYARSPKQLLWLVIPMPIMLSQLWLFMWAPINGEGIAVAMGYFLFPLMMVLAGCVLFKEKLVGLQRFAVLFAACGVTLEIFQGGSLSWATFWVCGTYPIYYIMRRLQGVRAMTGLFVDTVVFVPIGVVYLIINAQSSLFGLGLFDFVKIFGLGAISVLAFVANLQAVRLLPVTLFGMLSYLEPLLLFVLAITVLGESLTAQMVLSYGLIWLGVMCLIGHGLIKQKQI